MKLEGLHILLTYQCTYECDHCFVWGSPWQTGTLTLEQIEDILDQAKEAGVTSIYFEGGEPFLYYAVLVRAVHKAADMGFSVGIVSNAYWANSVADAAEWLRPFAGRVSDLSVSSDLFHCEKCLGERPQNAVVAAKWLGIPTGVITVAQPDEASKESHGQLEEEESDVMYRGRAVEKLASRAPSHPWEGFDCCPHEDLREPGRVHLDPLGNLHVCQGIIIGNLFEKPLKQICEEYDPDTHPICGPLLAGGPAALVTEYNLRHASSYADACHLCYLARTTLRARFPELLAPDQMYGAMS
ncbi:MAG: radical SAM protein [Anaerolineales bacterium]|nr:radical SAM protein [Anaerolineales bacterium]NUQ86749.1 radical SAM protein [Anaerolineales bacterium]